MIRKIIFIISFIPIISIAQMKPNYEKIALEYYLDSIVKNKKKKIRIDSKLLNTRTYLNVKCLKENLNINVKDTLKGYLTSNYNNVIELRESSRIIPEKFSEYQYRVIAVCPATKFPNGKIITSIVDNRTLRSKVYLIELNEEGKVIYWCN